MSGYARSCAHWVTSEPDDHGWKICFVCGGLVKHTLGAWSKESVTFVQNLPVKDET